MNRKVITGIRLDIFEHSECISFDMLMKYKNNKLSREKTYSVERHLVDCEICSDILDGLCSVKSDQEIFSRINKINSRLKYHIGSMGYRKNRIYRLIAIAAVFLGVLMLIGPESRSINNKIFNYYYSSFPNLIPITRGETPDTLLMKGMHAYDLHDYKRSKKILESIPDREDNYLIAAFYLGIIYLDDGRLTKAEIKFKEIITADYPLLSEHAAWYLALIHLKRNDILNLKVICNKIENEESIYINACNDILREFKARE